MEHISRGVLPSMQTAILVSDCSRRGVQAVGRIAELIKEETEKINELAENQQTICSSLNAIRELMAWKEVE